MPLDVTLTICNYREQSLGTNFDFPSNVKVVLLPPLTQDRLRNEIIRNDLFTLTSRLETFSLALLEAMSTGILFITTNKHGIVERFPNELNRFIVPFGKPNILSDKILELHNYDVQTKTFLSKTIREFTLNFNWNTVANKFFENYKKIISIYQK